MELLTNTGDFIELIIYIAIFIGISLYSTFKTKKQKPNKNNDDIVIQETKQDNATINTSWKNNKSGSPYQINRYKNNNPIFGSSKTNISYTRTLIIFLAVAICAVLIIAYITGEYNKFLNFIN